MRNFWSIYRYPILWAAFILFICGVNGSYIPHIRLKDFISPDKIAHMTLFGIQAYLLGLGLRKQLRVFPALLTALLLTILYGVLIEFLQATIFVNRSFDYLDMLANTAGAIVAGVFLWRKFNKFSVRV